MHHSLVSGEIILLYVFSWNFIWFEQKGAHQSAKYRAFDCWHEISQNLYFDRLLLLKVYKISVKKCSGVMSHVTEKWCKIWIKTDLLFQKWQEFDEFWLEHSKMSKICNLMGSSWPKYIMFELKMYRGNYLSWRWRMMQNLKENWLVVWKMTWQIWQIFTRALRSIKVGTMMGSFYPQYKMYELKIYQRIMCHGNEERCKIWRIDLLFQNWHEENDKFWPAEHVKVSKICSLMDSFWPK